MTAKKILFNGKPFCEPLPMYWLIVTTEEVWYCTEIELENSDAVVTEDGDTNDCDEEEADDDDDDDDVAAKDVEVDDVVVVGTEDDEEMAGLAVDVSSVLVDGVTDGVAVEGCSSVDDGEELYGDNELVEDSVFVEADDIEIDGSGVNVDEDG